MAVWQRDKEGETASSCYLRRGRRGERERREGGTERGGSFADSQKERFVRFHFLLELEEAVHETLRRGRAARDVDIDRDDSIAASHDGVGVMIIAAAIGTGAH
jgi:hypothetical protein